MIEVSSDEIEKISEDIFSLANMMHREALMDTRFLVPKSSFGKQVAYVGDKAFVFKTNTKSEAHFDALCKALNGLRSMFGLEPLTL